MPRSAFHALTTSLLHQRVARVGQLDDLIRKSVRLGRARAPIGGPKLRTLLEMPPQKKH